MLDINIENKSYNDSLILDNININIKNGEFISFIGPSGCGKTSLLSIISNIDENYTGHVLLNNKKIDYAIGFMFQDSRLLPWLNIKDNLLLILKDKTKEYLIEDLLIEVGLKDYIKAYPKELSGGMQRRVALCRAFINNPSLVLLDEPFVSLDYPSTQELRYLFIKFYKKYKPTVLLVTHNLREAIMLSNKIIFLSAKPTKIILTYQNNSFLDNLEDKNIDLTHKDILNKYPDILNGNIT